MISVFEFLGPNSPAVTNNNNDNYDTSMVLFFPGATRTSGQEKPAPIGPIILKGSLLGDLAQPRVTLVTLMNL